MAATRDIQMIGNVSPGNNEFVLTLHPEYRTALLGLSQFSHAVILWWAHQCEAQDDRNQRILKRPYIKSNDDVGVFGSRSPTRPNPIGLSIVAIQSVDEKRGLVIMPFIDTEPETPIVDIKPYFPASDRVREAAVPAWCQHWPQYYEDSATFDWRDEFA